MDDEPDSGASTFQISQPETQFIPQEDDLEVLWEVIEITAEKAKQYRVRWAGNDPKTRKPWPQSWVPKHDCTDDLVLAWKHKKSGAERKKPTKRVPRKSGKSAISRASAASRDSSAVLSSTNTVTKSHTRSNATATPRAGPSNAKSPSHSLSKFTLASNHKSSATLNSNGKRKRNVSPSTSLPHPPSDEGNQSLPEIATLSEIRPRKKRRVEVEVVAAPEPEPEISQESYDIKPAGAWKQGRALLVREEEEEDEGEDEDEMETKGTKAKTGKASNRFSNRVSRKQISAKPKLDKGKGKALPSPSEDEQGEQEDNFSPAHKSPSVRAPARAPIAPTSKELEERKAQAIAKKKSQLAQALREPSVDRQLPAVKRVSSSKPSKSAPAKKPVASASPKRVKTTVVETSNDEDSDIPPLRKKRDLRLPVPPADPPTSPPAQGRAAQGPRADLRRTPSTSTIISEPKSKPNLKLAETPKVKPVPGPLLSPTTVVQLQEFDKWVTESEARSRRVVQEGEQANEIEHGDDRPVPIPLILNNEVQGMYKDFVDFDGNGGDGQWPAPIPVPVPAPIDPVPIPQLQPAVPASSRTAEAAPSLARHRQQRQRQRQRQRPPSPPTPSPQGANPQIARMRMGSLESGHVNGRDQGDSYRQGVVPETEAEESSNNTQSQSQSQSQPKQATESPPAPTPIISESSLVKNSTGEGTRPGGSRLQKNGTAEAVAEKASNKKLGVIEAQATIPDLSANAQASGSGSALQRNGTMTPKLVSRMKPRTPGSVAKLGVGMNGLGKVPVLPSVLEDEHQLYLNHEDFGSGGMELMNGGTDATPSPLQGRSKAAAPMAMTQDSITAEATSLSADNHDNPPEPSSPPPITTLPTTTSDKLLRPIPVLSPSRFAPHLPPTSSISNVERETEERELEPLMSSIEQFSSPENGGRRRRQKRIGLREKGKAPESSSDVDKGDDGLEHDEVVEDLVARMRRRGEELAQQAMKEQMKERERGRKARKRDIKLLFERAVKGKDKDKDIRSSGRQDGAAAPRNRSIENRGVGLGQPSAQAKARAPVVGEGKEKAKEGVQVGNAMIVDNIIELREEEEESTQDLLGQAQEQRRTLEVAHTEVGWDLVVQQDAGEELDQGQEHGQDREQQPEQMPQDVPEIPQTTTMDPQPGEDMMDKPSSQASSKPKSKAGSDRSAGSVHEEPELVLSPTASTYHNTPEPSPETPPKDGLEPLGAAMALLNAKSLEISKLDAMLVAEQAKTEALSIEMDVLQAELVTARNGPRPPEAHLGLELTEARKALVQEGADWEAERNTMLASIEELKRAKENAQNDRDFFRDQYGQASAFVSSVRKENDELEARAKTAEGQAKTGVEMVKATFVQRVRWLEDDARTWRQTAQHLMEMDKRTRGEELRKRAGEAPELRKKCDDLEERNELLCERLEELEGELDAKVRQEGVKELEEQLVQSRNEEGAWQMELESWRNETLRLNVELNEMKAELERVKADVGGGKEASPGDYGMVYRCQWRPEGSNDACEGLFLNIEELQNHLFSGGHLRR